MVNRPYLKLYHLVKGYVFTKEFDTEFDRDKFERKLKYSKQLKVVAKG